MTPSTETRSRRTRLAGALALVAVTLVTFYPGLRMGFYLDDYVYLERAVRTDWSNALVQILDPRVQVQWYRPLQAVQFLLEYNVFGGNANVYHVVNIGFHAINVLLLYALAWRISKKWLVGLLSALVYATFSVYATGVNWIGIVDPLTAVFYLLSIWFWWLYLEGERSRHYWLAFGSFVLALSCKQTSVTVPIVMFLADRWLMGRPMPIAGWVRRYGVFVVTTVLYVVLQAGTQSTQTFAGVFGWQVGTSMAFILLQYLVLFFLPWGIFPPLDYQIVQVGDVWTYTWLGIALVLYAYVAYLKRSRVLLFLGAFALLTLLPVLPFPFIEHRYIYIPMLAGAAVLALLIDHARMVLKNPAIFRWTASGMLALLAFGNGFAVSGAAAGAAEWARQLRVPFRDIERVHPSYPKDTLLYFIDPITPTTGGLSGMFLLRYGRDIYVKNWTEYAGLRDHPAAFIYYFDDARVAHEIPVAKDAPTQASPALPVTFQAPIRLEGYEVSQTAVKPGGVIALILYFRGTGTIDRNYTVFVHLVDSKGHVVSGYDSEPRKSKAPTSEWVPTLLQADPVLLPVGPDTPLGGDYEIEVGIYYLPTMQRLAVLDANGRVLTDVINIGPFRIIE